MKPLPDLGKLRRELSAPIANWLMDVLQEFDDRLDCLEISTNVSDELKTQLNTLEKSFDKLKAKPVKKKTTRKKVTKKK